MYQVLYPVTFQPTAVSFQHLAIYLSTQNPKIHISKLETAANFKATKHNST